MGKMVCKKQKFFLSILSLLSPDFLCPIWCTQKRVCGGSRAKTRFLANLSFFLSLSQFSPHCGRAIDPHLLLNSRWGQLSKANCQRCLGEMPFKNQKFFANSFLFSDIISVFSSLRTHRWPTLFSFVAKKSLGPTIKRVWAPYTVWGKCHAKTRRFF